MDVNQSILGFKYSENEENISLSPPKGIRTISYLRRVGEFFQWFQIPEPHHDSNKLYASFRGIPTNTWVELDLEDLGLEADGFNAEGERQDEVQLMDFIGAGWMDTSDAAVDSKMMVACGQEGRQTWSITKIQEFPADVGDATSYIGSQKCDIAIPFIQPKRVVTDKGVYFVG